MPTEEFNLMQTVKRRFYAMRNGALAEQMRRGGLDYRINFGLNIPQIKEIATEIIGWGLPLDQLTELACSLWDNINTRESRLLAPMLYPATAMEAPLATKWLAEAQTTEVADHLCHSLLRRLPYAPELMRATLDNINATPLNRYCALRLALNLLITGKITPDEAKKTALNESAMGHSDTRAIAAQLLAEAGFRAEMRSEQGEIRI